MDTVRVLQVVDQMESGGGFIMNLYRKLDRTKLQFDFAVHQDGEFQYRDEIIKRGGRVYGWSPAHSRNVRDYYQAADRFFGEHKEYRVVHGHITNSSALYLMAAKKNDVPCRIAHSHCTPGDRRAGGLGLGVTQIPLRYTANELFASSKTAAQLTFGKKLGSSDYVRIIPDTIDVGRFVYREEVRERVRAQLSVEDRFVVGHVGNFTADGGHLFLLEIFAVLCQKDPASLLVLVGEGEGEGEIHARVAQLGLTDCVGFLGQTGGLDRLLQGFDALVLTSEREDQERLLQAQAAGLSCFAGIGSVPGETRVSNILQFIDLKQPPAVWADQILRSRQNRQRSDKAAQLINAGYDAGRLAEKMQRYYLKYYGR